MTTPTPGAMFVVGGRPYIDSQTLHNLTRTHHVAPVAGGYKVLGPDGHAVLCLGTSCPPLPEQRGALYETRATRGTRLTDECATWLARGAARLAGKFAAFPTVTSSKTASGCVCGVSCGCGPCQHRHAEVRASAGVSDEEAAQFVLDFLAQKLPGFQAETEMMRPWGFRIVLFRQVQERRERVVTVEAQNRETVDILWDTRVDETTRDDILTAIDSALNLAFAPVPDKPANEREVAVDHVTDEDAAQYVLDTVVFEVGDYMPETERREPSGFFLHLYLIDGPNEQRAATFEIEGRHSLKIVWMVQPTSATLRSKIAAVIDRLVQEAYDKENHRDSE